MAIRKITLLFLFLFSLLFLQPVFAQTTGSCSSSYSSRVQNGLISTPEIIFGSKLGSTSGTCVVDPKAAFAPEEVPTYEDLKSLYFTQYKSTASKTEFPGANKNDAHIDPGTTNDQIFLVNGDLVWRNCACSVTGTKVGVVFVEGNFHIRRPIGYTYGLVFIVKGDVFIDPASTNPADTINAVIISQGTICTAADFTNPNNPTCPSSNVSARQLVINGSLISLNKDKPIQFKRSLADNNDPAEKINHDVKYLVILRNLISDTYQRWSEIL